MRIFGVLLTISFTDWRHTVARTRWPEPPLGTERESGTEREREREIDRERERTREMRKKIIACSEKQQNVNFS